MKKFTVIAVPLLAALAALAYVLLDSRSAGPESSPGSAPARKAEPPSAAPSEAAARENGGSVQEADAVVGESIQSGARTEFTLFRGEMGYVDVDSVVRDRNPYSVVALLQKHHAFSGADASLELEIESVTQANEGHMAHFAQMIGDMPTPGRGVVSFDLSGAVYSARGVLVDPQSAGAGSVEILQAEAEAIAREAAARFVESRRRARYAERGPPLRVESNPGELRYGLDPAAGNELRAEWRVLVGTYNPPDNLEVLVAAETGEVVGVKSVLQHRAVQAGCATVEFRVCDGTSAQTESCDYSLLNQVELIYDGKKCVAEDGSRCKEARFETPKDAAYESIELVESIGAEYLHGVGGDDCTIDIVVGNAFC